MNHVAGIYSLAGVWVQVNQEVFSRMVEAPRGEAVHFVQTGGDNRPYRWRVGAPSYPNLPSINNADHHPVTNMLCRCWTLLEVQEVQAALWCRQTGQDQWS